MILKSLLLLDLPSIQWYFLPPAWITHFSGQNLDFHYQYLQLYAPHFLMTNPTPFLQFPNSNDSSALPGPYSILPTPLSCPHCPHAPGPSLDDLSLAYPLNSFLLSQSIIYSSGKKKRKEIHLQSNSVVQSSGWAQSSCSPIPQEYCPATLFSFPLYCFIPISMLLSAILKNTTYSCHKCKSPNAIMSRHQTTPKLKDSLQNKWSTRKSWWNKDKERPFQNKGN